MGATDSCVARLDLNGDELIGLAEMKPYENAYATERFGAVPLAATYAGTSDSLPVVALGADAGRFRLARRLIGKYDRAHLRRPQATVV